MRRGEEGEGGGAPYLMRQALALVLPLRKSNVIPS